jgi:Ca2+-binding RTX toxin-like protein
VFILTAGGGGLPPNTVFTFDLGGGQTVSGPSGTTVTFTFGSFGPATVSFDSVTVAVNGITSPQVQFNFPLLPFNIEPDPGNPSQSALVLSGTYGGETLDISPGANNAVEATFLHGSALVNQGGISTPSGVAFAQIIINGGGNTGAIHLTGGLAVPALILSDGTLDASGSIANNILVGQGGNDTLQGGSGRDILIAGTGAGMLKGGSGDDILIGGYTSYDGNITALLAIMAEWGRTDADYNTRIAHLMGTQSGGLNGSYFLNGTTVFDNGLTDALEGGAGMDWFFAHTSTKNGDTIRNLRSGEVVTSI